MIASVASTAMCSTTLEAAANDPPQCSTHGPCPALEPRITHATDLELDGHGRILLPPELRQFAGLERIGMLIGQGNRFELWNESRWGERLDEWLKTEEAATDLPSELDSLSL